MFVLCFTVCVAPWHAHASHGIKHCLADLIMFIRVTVVKWNFRGRLPSHVPIWRVPMGVPLNHSFIDWFSNLNKPFWSVCIIIYDICGNPWQPLYYPFANPRPTACSRCSQESMAHGQWHWETSRAVVWQHRDPEMAGRNALQPATAPWRAIGRNSFLATWSPCISFFAEKLVPEVLDGLKWFEASLCQSHPISDS